MPAGSRNLTTVAPQALFMMNSTLVAQACERITARLLAQDASDQEKQLRDACQLILSREPTDREMKLWVSFLQKRTKLEMESGAAKSDQAREVWKSLVRVLLSSNEFVYVK